MCGIAGILNCRDRGRKALADTVTAMTAALAHRGPDDEGIWVDPSAGVALGHRRLAVVELSKLGAQPMRSADGRLIAAFNGEIYNFRDLRSRLESNCAFRGSSDTEVLLAAVSEWGLERALAEFNGMFALALWDTARQKLYLARDRAGEKPLYYGRSGIGFVFASELSALETDPDGLGEMDRAALAAYLEFGYVPAPLSIYSRIRKLPPGCLLEVDSDGCHSDPKSYWSAERIAIAGRTNRLRCSAEEAVESTEALLSDAVRIQTAADVPVGAFLSGGIDSSLVVALMCRHSSRVRTFTVGFAESGYDEAVYARAVARHLGTNHTEFVLTASDAMSVIPKLSSIYSEPFADASQIPTFLVSENARRHVTVALSGDGGDEFFGGYNRYFWAEAIWRGIRCFPHPLRRAIGRASSTIPISVIDRLAAAGALLAPDRLRARNLGDKLHKVANILCARDAADVYARLVTNWGEPLMEGDASAVAVWPAACQDNLSFTERMMQRDAVTYLPDDILVKVDRASMANSLEVRTPFLDRRLMEFAWRLPLTFKVRSGEGKWVLKQVLHRYVPAALVDRPKAGFAIPLHEWLRGPLREWAEDLLSESRLRREGLLRPAPIRRRWREHLSGTRNWIAPLWTVLMFQAWNARRRSSQSSFARDLRLAVH